MNEDFWTIVVAAAAITTANLTAFGFVFLAFHGFREDLRALNTRIDSVLQRPRAGPLPRTIRRQRDGVSLCLGMCTILSLQYKQRALSP